MAFRVEIAPLAFENLDTLAEYIRERGSFESTERWFNGIIDAIRTLGESPGRCPLADEFPDLGAEVRLLLYGGRNRRYKIYFAIHNETRAIRVFHFRHWASRPMAPEELVDLIDEIGEEEPDS